MNARLLGYLAAVGSLVSGCGSTSGPAASPSSQTTTSASPCAHLSNGVHLALAAVGAPDPNSSAFRDDQQNLYDASQFPDAATYPPGYHWKVDTRFSPADVVSASTVPINPAAGSPWAVVLHLTPAGTDRFHADAAAAGSAPSGSPQSRVAIFVGPRVVSAPEVLAPQTGSDVQVTVLPGRQQAAAMAAQIAACR